MNLFYVVVLWFFLWSGSFLAQAKVICASPNQTTGTEAENVNSVCNPESQTGTAVDRDVHVDLVVKNVTAGEETADSSGSTPTDHQRDAGNSETTK